MGHIELEELRRRKRDQTVRMMEASDLTSQMAAAADRNDQVSMQLLLTMRETPIRQAFEIGESIEAYLLSLPEEEAIRYSALLHGAEPRTPEETALTDQTAQFQRLLKTVSDADKRLSLKLGGHRSFYNKFRE